MSDEEFHAFFWFLREPWFWFIFLVLGLKFVFAPTTSDREGGE